MAKTRQHGFSVVEIVLGIVVIACIIALSWYVYNANQNKTATAKNTQQAATTPTQYLALSEWGVKVPLTEATKNATYRYENNIVYLDVAIQGDTTGACKNQATVTRLTDLEEGRTYSKVGNYYYVITPAQDGCTTDTVLQGAAALVHQAWADQGTKIVAE